MTCLKTFLSFGFSFIITLAIAQTPSAAKSENNGYPREHVLDIEKMVVEVSFKPEERKVLGKVTHYATPLRKNVDSIFFDGPSIEIKQVLINNNKTKFTTNNRGVTIFPNPTLHWSSNVIIEIEYEATPEKGIYFVGWDDPKNLCRKQIWTQGQGIDNRHWIPMYDDRNDKMITETVVTVDKKFKVLSNGKKYSVKDNNNGTQTWHYGMLHPHSNYLIMLGIGEYEIDSFRTKKENIPIYHYYYADQKDRVIPTYLHTEGMFEFMNKETGIPYPWESYSQIPVQDFMYGAMENTTATLFTDNIFIDSRQFLDRNYVGVNIHEFAHQWFGDYITARSPFGAWLQEAYATYYSKRYRKEVFGQDEYEWLQYSEGQSTLNDNKIPVVSPNAGRKIYYKGSFVIEMLRYVLGDEEYQKTIYHYLKNHPYTVVETNDLYQSIQDTLGLTLNWFFDQWLYNGGEPHYKISYEALIDQKGNHRTDIMVEQIHQINTETGLFKMPVNFEVHYTDGSYDKKQAWIENQYEIVKIPNYKKKSIAFVLFDPGNNILKSITFDRSFEELAAQALKAPHMIDRYEALLALDKFSIEKKRNTLLKAFNQEAFYITKSEAIRQLLEDEDAQSRTAVKKALSDPASEVRKTVIRDIQNIPVSLLPSFETLLQDSSYHIIGLSLDKLSNQFPDNRNKYLEQTKNEIGHNYNIRIKWLELSALTNKAAIDSLKRFASMSYDFQTRINAMHTLKHLNYLDEELLGYLVNATAHFNNKLSGSAETVLKYFLQQNEYETLIKKYHKKISGKDKEILSNIIKT